MSRSGSRSSLADAGSTTDGSSVDPSVLYRPSTVVRLALQEAVEDAPGELIVHAEPNDMIVQADALIARKRRAGSRVEIRFILQPDIEVFDFALQSGVSFISTPPPTVQPQCQCLSEIWPTGPKLLDVHAGECRAAGSVNQPVILRIAEPPAVGGKPRLLHLIAERAGGREIEGASLLAGDRSIALVAINETTILEIVSRGKPDDATPQIEARRLIEAGQIVMDDAAAPCTAARYADVGACPIGDMRGRPVNRRDAKIGGENSRSRDQREQNGRCADSAAEIGTGHSSFGVELRRLGDSKSIAITSWKPDFAGVWRLGHTS